jgi:hypothetical protein
MRWFHDTLIRSLLLARSCAHMTTVCTATAPSRPSEILFFFGTYHTVSGASVPGSVHITTPTGSMLTGSFNSYCSNGGAITSSRGGTPACPAADLHANCGSGVLPSDGQVTCYAAHSSWTGSTQTTYVVADSCEAFPVTSGSYATNYANFYATVTGATSGTYTVRTTGTDANLDPCPYGTNYPCALSSTKDYSFELAVAGAGAACPSTLPPLPAEVDASSLSTCGGQFDGFVCPVSCQSNAPKTGIMICNNGTWDSTVICQAPPSTPAPESPPPPPPPSSPPALPPSTPPEPPSLPPPSRPPPSRPPPSLPPPLSPLSRSVEATIQTVGSVLTVGIGLSVVAAVGFSIGSATASAGGSAAGAGGTGGATTSAGGTIGPLLLGAQRFASTSGLAGEAQQGVSESLSWVSGEVSLVGASPDGVAQRLLSEHPHSRGGVEPSR